MRIGASIHEIGTSAYGEIRTERTQDVKFQTSSTWPFFIPIFSQGLNVHGSVFFA